MYPLGWSNAPYVKNEVPVTGFPTGVKNVGEGGAVSLPPSPSFSLIWREGSSKFGGGGWSQYMGDGGLKTFLKSS